MTKKKKITILILAILTLAFIPDIAQGVVGTGFFDYFKAMHAGLSPVVGPYYSMLIIAGLTYIISFILFYFAAFFLEHSLVFTIKHLTLDADIVELGWTFVVGIANISIVIALLIAGVALILKLEGIDPKKLITNSIIIALLMNFTLVFVGMMIDVSNILYNTVLREMLGNRPIGEMAREMLITGEGMLKIFGLFGAMVIKQAVPVLSPFTSIGLILTSHVFLIPTVVDFIFQIVLFLALGGIFFTYAIIFVARVFVIQILAILSPIAFACLALPNQKGIFDKWLKYMVSWLFTGIFFIFFLAIGFQLSEILRDNENLDIVLPLGITISGLMYYVYLAIYFGLILALGKKMIPLGAEAGIAQMKSIGAATTPFVGQYLQDVKKGRIEQEMKNEEWKKEDQERTRPRTTGEFFRSPSLVSRKLGRKQAEWSARISGTTYEAQKKKLIEEEAARPEKEYGNDYKEAMEVEGRPENRAKFNSPQAKAGRALYLAKAGGEKGLNEMGEDDLKKALKILAGSHPDKIIDIAKYKQELIKDPEMAPLLTENLVDKGMDDKDVKDIIDSNIQINVNGTLKSSSLLAEEAKNDDDAGKIAKKALLEETTRKKMMSALSKDDIKKLSDSFVQSDEFKRGTLMYKDIGFIRSIGEQKGSLAVKEIDKMAKTIMPEINKINLSLIKSAEKIAAGGTVLPGLNREINIQKETIKIQNKIKDRKREIEKKKAQEE